MKNLFSIVIISCFSLFSCSKISESTQTDIEKPTEMETKAGSSFHWTCSNCGMLNSPWQNNCVSCNKSYSEEHGYAVTTFVNMVATSIQTTLPGDTGGNTNAGSIQLPDMTWTITVPQKWYETTSVINYYNTWMGDILLPPDYRNGFEVAWYRTVRVLYPGLHNNMTTLEREHRDWEWEYRSSIRSKYGQFGTGLLDGTEAAVTAYIDYR